MHRYYFPSMKLLLPLFLLLATVHCSFSWAVTPADVSFETAVQYLTIGNDQRAVDALQDFLKNYPADARALQATFLLGCGFQNLKNYDRALPLFAQVSTKSTDDELRANAWYQAAECHRSLKTAPANESAAAAYQSFLKIAEKIDLTGKDDASRKNWQARIINAHFWRADALAQNGNDTDALGEYQQVLLIAPKDSLAPWACYASGLLHFNKGRFSEAVSMLERISSDYPDSEIAGEAKFTLGQAYAGKAKATADPAAKKELSAQAIVTLQAVAGEEKVTVNTRQKALLIIAHLQQDNGNLPAAITALEQVLKIGDATQRETVETRMQYAHLLTNEKRYQDAVVNYAQISAQKNFPDLAQEAFYWQGVALFKQAVITHEVKQYRAAIAALRSYLDTPVVKNDRSADATLILAFCYEDLANAGEADAQENALSTFKQIQEKWPNSDQALQAGDGISRMMRSMTPEQLRVLIGKLPAGMTNWDVALQLAFAEYNATHYAKSLEAANQALKENLTPDVKAQALYLVGASQYQLSALPEAIAAFQQVLTIAPQGELIPFARRALVQAYLDSRQFPLATTTALALQQDKLTATEAALQQEEKAERLILLAAAYQENKQYQEATATYQQIIQLYPQSKWAATALMHNAWIAFSQNDKTAAMAYYQQLVEKYPIHELMPDACIQWADILVEQKEYDRAIALYKKVPADAPLAAQAAFDIGWTLLKMEKKDDSRAQFIRVTEMYPASPFAADSYSQLGEIAFQQQQYEEAVNFFAKAAAAAVNTEDAAAIIYHLRGKRLQRRSIPHRRRFFPASSHKISRF